MLEYGLITKRLVDAAKQPGFSVDSWAPLAELIAPTTFVRVGNFKEVMDWQQYVDFLTNWATSSEWECSLQAGHRDAGTWCSSNSKSAARIGDFEQRRSTRCRSMSSTPPARSRHVDVYLQMALPDPDMLASYDGVEISE